jgi:hypothetical protein
VPPSDPEPLDELPEEPTDDPPEQDPPQDPTAGEALPEEPPPSGPCLALPSSGGIIDEDTNCLRLRGPADFWNHEKDGLGAGLAWTSVFQSGQHVNSAEWTINLEEAGDYQIEIYVEPAFGTYTHARYFLEHGTANTQIIADQSQGSGWLSLGSFEFTAGESLLTLYDNTDGAVESGTTIVVDAIRLTPEGAVPEDPGAGDPGDDPGSQDPGTDDPSSQDPTGGDPGDGGSSQDPGDGSGTPDPGDSGNPDSDGPGDDGAPAGIVTNGCQAAPGSSPLGSALVLLLAFLSLCRRRWHRQ